MDLIGVLDIAGKTDTGMVRSQNEDSIGESASLGTIVLADGMGGYQSGEIASALAVNTILNYLHEHLADLPPGNFNEETGYSEESILARTAIKLANEAIYKAASSKKEYHGMGTTVVPGIFHDNRLTIAHVGDSRMYRARDSGSLPAPGTGGSWFLLTAGSGSHPEQEPGNACTGNRSISGGGYRRS